MSQKWFTWIILAVTVCIVIVVLFAPPQPGVADQGDFQRVMDIAGLEEADSSLADNDLRFYKYVKTQYTMTPVNPLRFLGIIPSSSTLYPIMLARLACIIAGMPLFDTRVLAAFYALLYITALWLCLRWSGIKRITTFVFFSLLSILVLLDGNYLIWFNSLYGEPMMISGLVLFAASILYAANKKAIRYKETLFFWLSALLFLGSKAQCITALPFVAILLHRVNAGHQEGQWHHRQLHIASGLRIVLPLVLLLFYAGGIFLQQSKTCGVDTKYNAVFYGILKNTKDPQKDLEALGLSGALAVEAGKHAYLPHSEYEKYIPWSDITETEFNQKITNMKLVQFYLLNPRRLLEGMEYTASQSFQTGTFLGKFQKKDISEYQYQFNRFTYWSDFRSTFLPKKLWFIILFFLAILIISIIEYAKRRDDKAYRLRTELVWTILAIGTFQFPMPFVGNGEADTAKQLFLFNFTFDLLLIIACTWVFSKIFFSNVKN